MYNISKKLFTEEKMKKLVCLCLSLVIAVLQGSCSSAGNAGSSFAQKSNKKVKISVLANVAGGADSSLENALADFESKSGYQVEFSSPGENYENIMKANMASGNMPDVFFTHGWSINRYKNYLMPVNDLPFADRILNQIKPVITDKDGLIYVLPIDIDISGIVYNADVLAKAGIRAEKIQTWDDFALACKAIKEKGYSPIQLCAQDSRAVGQLFDRVSPSFFITNPGHNLRSSLKNGAFDSATWKNVANLVSGWRKSGYFNADLLTIKNESCIKSVAEGKSAFVFTDNSFILAAKEIRESCNLNMMPIPSCSREDAPSLVADEGIALGIWKNSPNKEAATALLNYLAQPEVANKIAASQGKPAALSSGKSESVTTSGVNYEKYRNTATYPYFDRQYLPTGLWDVMCSTGQDIVSLKPGAVDASVSAMEKNFKEKFYVMR